MVAAEASAYLNDHVISYLWTCDTCGYGFVTKHSVKRFACNWLKISWSNVTARLSGARLFLVLNFLTVPLRSPDLGWGTPVHLRKDRIETTQAAEPSSRRNLDHRQFGIVQQSLRPLHTRGLGNLTGAGAEMFFEQSG
jgi:hypothetical protein